MTEKTIDSVQPADDRAVSDSLVELCRDHGGLIASGERAYRVTCATGVYYAFSNSPGQAALSVCSVERVKDRELTEAAFEALMKNTRHPTRQSPGA